ncbi:MAG: asparagine--tRNA ligase [Treponema sp.]|jgi:asparaginyl-tRNA synthetase|nr:asparagine--tRNA ligase [Treponema sp.]
MLFPLIKDILSFPPDSRKLKVRGWIRTKRELKNLVFIELNDGSSFRGLQCAFDREIYGRDFYGKNAGPADKTGAGGTAEETPDPLSILDAAGTGASVEIEGTLVPSPAAGQQLELASDTIRLIGPAPAEPRPGIPAYPLQKKRHSLEFLREIAHLRPRTNTFAAVTRLRSRLAFAVHQFFQRNGYQYIHTPIITASDAEGAGAMFQVTTLDLETLARNREERLSPGGPGGSGECGERGDAPQPVDYSSDFFGKKTGLTVSGQLEAETYASALSRVYTFGPTFRAEHSNTTRHLAEFWMVEPETAFADLDDNMSLAEEFLKFLITTALEDCAEELAFFDTHYEKGLRENLETLAHSPFSHISYTDAIAELEKNTKTFEFKPSWGCDLQSEHERYLTETVFRGPVIVTDYPKEIKAFYMKLNDDSATVRAMDVLVPRLGEIIGGSQREEDLEKLTARMTQLRMNPADYQWYLDLRRYGTTPHSGFGLGFERLIQYLTGMTNIRDVIPYPRSAGQAEF